MRRWTRLCGLPALPVSLLWPLAVALAQTSTAPARVHIAGTVLNGVTGKPVRRALVSSLDNRYAMLTDSEGRFSFDVPAPATDQQPSAGPVGSFEIGRNRGFFGVGDSFGLRVQKPGFLPDDEPRIVPLAAAGSTAGPLPSVELRILPAAVVSGTVSAAVTDGAHGVPVLLLKHEVQDGDRIWLQAGSVTTDSHGSFRFADLRPGEYSVMTGEWRGDRPLSVEAGAITEQYPPVFLGDTATLTPAGILRLHAGDTAQAPLHLHLATYIPVTIPVPSATAWLQIQILPADGLSQFQLGYSPGDHAVEGALPAGRYTVLLTGPIEPQSFATVALQVGNTPVRTAPVTLLPSLALPVHVRRELAHQPPPGTFNVNVLLRPEEQARGTVGANNQPGDRDEFSLNNVQPGRYRVTVQCAPGYVSSLLSGSTDLLHEPLVVGAGGTAAPIRVTVRDDGATVTGAVTTDGSSTPPPRSFVLLLPTSSNGQFAEGFAGPDGKFSIENVVPGAYRLVAFRSHPGQLPFRDPDAMRDFLGENSASEGVTLTTAPGETVRKDVPVLDHLPDQP